MSHHMQAYLYSKVNLEGMDIIQLAEASLFNLLAFEDPTRQAPWLIRWSPIFSRIKNSLNVPASEVPSLALYPYDDQSFNGNLSVILCTATPSKDKYGTPPMILGPRTRVVKVLTFIDYLRRLEHYRYRKAIVESTNAKMNYLRHNNDYIVFKD